MIRYLCGKRRQLWRKMHYGNFNRWQQFETRPPRGRQPTSARVESPHTGRRMLCAKNGEFCNELLRTRASKATSKVLKFLRARFSQKKVAVWHYGSPSHRVVEQQLLIPGFFTEFRNLEYLENSWKMSAKGIEPGPTEWKSDDLTITPVHHSYFMVIGLKLRKYKWNY